MDGCGLFYQHSVPAGAALTRHNGATGPLPTGQLSNVVRRRTCPALIFLLNAGSLIVLFFTAGNGRTARGGDVGASKCNHTV